MLYIIVSVIAGMLLAAPLLVVAWLIAVGTQLVRRQVDRRRARRAVELSLSVLITVAWIVTDWHLTSLILAASLLVGMWAAFAAMEWMASNLFIGTK
jgi:hypothetical protein